MIEGVKIKELGTFSDERGYFREVCRFPDFDVTPMQASHAFRVAGQSNGWHIHRYHDELFYVARGVLRLCLKDCRTGTGVRVSYPYDDLWDVTVNFGLSKTPDEYEEIVMSEHCTLAVLVPAGIAHGYKVLSDVDIFYFATKTYETSRHDEGRINAGRWSHDWMRGIPTK